jgi:hypothetical protein
MIQGHFLRDHPAHRHAQHVGPLDAERIEQADGVRRHEAGRVGRVGNRAPPGTPVVEADHPVARAERRHLKRPRQVVSPEPHDQQQRIPLARLDIVQLDPVHLHHRHPRLPFSPSDTCTRRCTSARTMLLANGLERGSHCS